MTKISQETENAIYQHVRQDLKPSPFAVIWRIGTAFTLGGLLSMFFCGQFGVGFSTLAQGWNHSIHAHIGATKCAIICGSIFSVLPAFILRMLSSGILFRVILRKYVISQIGLILIAGTFMYVNGSMMTELINVGAWSLSAFVSFKLLGYLILETSYLLNPAKI